MKRYIDNILLLFSFRAFYYTAKRECMLKDFREAEEIMTAVDIHQNIKLISNSNTPCNKQKLEDIILHRTADEQYLRNIIELVENKRKGKFTILTFKIIIQIH